MGKENGNGNDEGPSRERSVNWSNDATKYMLEWYIDCLKDKNVGFKFKKQHHFQCTDALNKKFGLGVTQVQTNRHYRQYKENWRIVERALKNSGNVWDAINCRVTVSESEKAQMTARARRYLNKPIKFFHQMQKIFTGCQADGCLATNYHTINEITDSEDGDEDYVRNVERYANTHNLAREDSGTIHVASPLTQPPTPIVTSLDDSSASISRGTKRKLGKQPIRRSRPRSRADESTNEFSSILRGIQESLANPPPLPIMPAIQDPYAPLWERIEAFTITTKDKINVGRFLSRPEEEAFRSFLSGASDATLQSWVYEHLNARDGVNGL